MLLIQNLHVWKNTITSSNTMNRVATHQDTKKFPDQKTILISR